MNKKVIKVAVTIAAVGVFGYLGGAVYAATADDGSHPPVPATMTYKHDLQPFTHLKNGGTVGSWRLDTPLKDRPDFVQVLVDGKTGYLKLSDIDDGFVMPQSTDGASTDVTKLMAAAKQRQKNVMAQPNAQGEVWAPVYGDDGETVIGKKLMNPTDDSSSN
jgi:hypothetical protein